MSSPFTRTIRSFEADGSPLWVVNLLVAGLVVASVTWLLRGRVIVYEVSEKARLEVKSAPHPIAASVSGRVLETRLAIGREVQEGEVLVVLDSEAEQLAIQERRVRREALAARRQAVQAEIQAEQTALDYQRDGRATAIEESRAQVAAAEARARLADRQVARLAVLHDRRAVSTDELQRGQAESEASRAAVRALSLATARLGHDHLVLESDRKTRLAKLEREAVELQGEAAIGEAAIKALEHEVALRTIRAPTSGRVGEVMAEFRVGSVVRAAEKIGCIVPAGELRAVAQFPLAAVGRVRPGQSARLRLDGFPWAQYGTIPATITDVGNEAGGGGLIRVELTLAVDPTSLIPVCHGLPGSAEVEVERISPAVLVLRAAGQMLAVKRPMKAA